MEHVAWCMRARALSFERCELHVLCERPPRMLVTRRSSLLRLIGSMSPVLVVVPVQALNIRNSAVTEHQKFDCGRKPEFCSFCYNNIKPRVLAALSNVEQPRMAIESQQQKVTAESASSRK